MAIIAAVVTVFLSALRLHPLGDGLSDRRPRGLGLGLVVHGGSVRSRIERRGLQVTLALAPGDILALLNDGFRELCDRRSISRAQRSEEGKRES